MVANGATPERNSNNMTAVICNHPIALAYARQRNVPVDAPELMSEVELAETTVAGLYDIAKAEGAKTKSKMPKAALRTAINENRQAQAGGVDIAKLSNRQRRRLAKNGII